MSARFELIALTAAAKPKGKGPSGIAWLVNETKALKGASGEADKKSGGQLKRLAGSAKFSGKANQVVSGLAPADLGYDYVILASLGKDSKPTAYENIGGALAAEANCLGLASLTVVVEAGAAEAAGVLFGARLRSYRFDKYRTTQKPEEKPTLAYVGVATAETKTANAAYVRYDALAQGIELTRDIVTEPANIIYPETLAAVCKGLEEYGVEVDILDEKAMKKLGMGSLLGVGQGSVRESRLVVMRWNGAGKEKPVAFIGKGVTFDTGGISIKPAKGMEEMKYDMGGSGTVIGLMKALALRKAKVNAIGAVGLVENMPDGNAQRPGDVVTSMSGQTIEVLNTDAEGRLVLADVLWYVQDKYKPQFMIDLATLTGAIIVALGNDRAGLFSNNDALAERLHTLGEQLGERSWRLPLGDEYDKQINSDIADMQNIGADREAGSITAAQFLQRFVNNTPWVHLDIAGTAWARKDQPITPKGAVGWGIRLLNALVETHYEKK